MIKCVKLDFLFAARMYTWRFVALFLLIGAVAPFLWESQMPMFSVLFALFAMLTMVTQPFFAQDKFTQILPATVSQRVFGRFFYGALSLMGTTAVGVGLSWLDEVLTGGGMKAQFLWIAVLLLGISIILLSLEFVVFYIFQIKNATVMSLVRMVPAFAFFYGILALPHDVTKGLPDILRYLTEHFAAVSLITLAAGFAVLMVCAAAACVFEKRKY